MADWCYLHCKLGANAPAPSIFTTAIVQRYAKATVVEVILQWQIMWMQPLVQSICNWNNVRCHHHQAQLYLAMAPGADNADMRLLLSPSRLHAPYGNRIP